MPACLPYYQSAFASLTSSKRGKTHDPLPNNRPLTLRISNPDHTAHDKEEADDVDEQTDNKAGDMHFEQGARQRHEVEEDDRAQDNAHADAAAVILCVASSRVEWT